MSLSALFKDADQNKTSGSKEIFGAEGAGEVVDWQQKYFDNLELHIREIKDEVRKSEDRIAMAIRDALQKVYLQSDQRHREYQNVNSRMDDMMARLDKKQDDQNRWILRTAITVIIGVAGLVSTGIFGLVKIFDLMPKP